MTRGAESAIGSLGQDRISLRDYICNVEIGAFGSERGSAQRLRFTLVLDVAPPSADLDDDVDGILSYDMLVEAVEHCLAEQRYDLLETLAERIAARALTHNRALHIQVRIEKLDRGPFALGVEISRSRAALAPALVDAATDTAAVSFHPWILVLAPELIGDPRLASWLGQIAGAARAHIGLDPLAPSGGLVVLPGPLSPRPELLDAPEAQLQIDLLSQDQAAWLLDGQGLDWRASVSRTEIDAVLAAGEVAVWAPARLVLSAPQDAG
ncbi:MAG: dihydroneopterin aldolase, partial [Mangrovicoccus sp.]|nr:dihydroneopterin aldolase [Mangrovicoccus sp.]